MNPLAPVLGQGPGPAPAEPAAAPERRRPGQLDAWGKVKAALGSAPGPLTCAELKAATGLPANNLSVALATHKGELVRTGASKPFRYALRGAA